MRWMSSVNTHTQISPLTLEATTNRCRPHKSSSYASFHLPWTLSSPLQFLFSWPTGPVSNHMAQSQGPSFSNTAVMCKTQVTSPLAEAWTSSTSLSVGHHPTRSHRQVDYSGRLARTCPGMPARHNCRPCGSSPYPGQPPGPRCYLQLAGRQHHTTVSWGLQSSLCTPSELWVEYHQKNWPDFTHKYKVKTNAMATYHKYKWGQNA